jgi:hypothetical protein
MPKNMESHNKKRISAAYYLLKKKVNLLKLIVTLVIDYGPSNSCYALFFKLRRGPIGFAPCQKVSPKRRTEA